MKRFLLPFLSLFLLIGSLKAQPYAKSQRLVLLEHHTGVDCGYCAQYNPLLETFMSQHPEKIISIKYQFYGNDPMETPESNARIAYYNGGSAPHSNLDGGYWDDHPAKLIQTPKILTDRYAVASPFNITLAHQISENKDSVHVVMKIQATEDISGTLKAHIAVVEEHIHFESAPGGNGETDFYNVLRKMLPNQNGTVLANMTSGQEITIKESWKFEDVYNVEEIAVVGFVQDDADKMIHQSSVSSSIPFNDYDVSPVAVKNPVETQCEETMKPVVRIRNKGGIDLTSLKIEYSVNAGETKTFDWTGNMKFKEEKEIELPTIDFTLGDENTLKIKTMSPNGQNDQITDNDELTFKFTPSPKVKPEVIMQLKLDKYGKENSWKLYNSIGEVIEQGGPYENDDTAVKIDTFEINPNECYKFVLADSYGDGFPGGLLRLKDTEGNLIIFMAGSDFKKEKVIPFGTNNSNAAISDKIIKKEIKVYPNPFKDELNINLDLTKSQNVNLKIYNSLGKCVAKEDYKNLSIGHNKLQFKNNNLSTGVYFLEIKIGNKIHRKKVIINK